MPIRAYDPVDDMLKIKSMQKKFRDSFNGTVLDPTKWDNSMDANTTYSVGSGNLTFNSSAVANAYGYILSTEYFTVPFRVSFGLGLSQRIANQTFVVEVVSIDPETMLPDGIHSAGILFDGTSATQAKHSVQNGGDPAVVSSAVVFPTTSGGVSLYEIEVFCDEAWFHGKTIDSASARANSYVRHKNLPDPNAIYKVRISWLNGTSAPASTTAATIPFVACQDYAELTAEITAGRGQSAAGQAMGVNVLGTAAVQGGTAHDSTATSTVPIKIGAQAQNAVPTAVSANNDMVNIIATMLGVPIVRPYSLPEGDWQFACAAPITNTTDLALKAAGAAGIRNYLTSIQLKNTNTTATEVVIKDGSTVIWRCHLGASMTDCSVIQFPTPLRGTAATALNIACITTGASVYVNAQGYQAP